MTLYYKYLLPFPTVLSTGRLDIPTVSAYPGMFLDTTLIESNQTSVNYNLPLLNAYTISGIFTTFSISDTSSPVEVDLGFGLNPFGFSFFGE